MKNTQTGLRLFLCMLLVFAPFGSLADDLAGQVYAEGSTFSGGTGTEVDPYIITTPAGLDEVRNHLDKHFKLGNDIDLTAYLAEGGAGYNGGAGWVPIGDDEIHFSGTFDGDGHTVTGLWINRPTEGYVGLFGHVNDGTIQNIGLVDVSVTGKNLVGSLAGYNISGTISHAWSSGHVMGNTEQIGGLVGYSNGTISHAWSGVTVQGLSYTGGLVGGNQGSINFAYTIGSVSGDGNYVGGITGSNNGTISNTWSSGAITGEDSAGGLVGYNGNGGSVSDSYWDTETTAQAGNGVGLNDGGTVASSVEGLSTSGALAQSSYDSFDFNNDWFIMEGSTRPFLRFEWSETINNAHQLQLMAMNLFESWNYTYTLAGDIDLAPHFSNKSDMWATDMTLTTPEGKGFAPIKDPEFVEVVFMGEFDGQDHTISGLYIHRPTEDDIGLFSYIAGGAIKNVHLQGGSVHGFYYVGALVGPNNGGDIHNVSVEVEVTGEGNFVGGLAGRNHRGDISNSSATGSVNGRDLVGGLLGQNWEGSVSLSYASGNVTGRDRVGSLIGFNDTSNVSNSYGIGDVQGSGNYIGGLVGYMKSGSVENAYSAGSVEGAGDNVGGLTGYISTGNVSYSYYDQETSEQSDAEKGEPRTTEQMKQQETFEPEWDFETIWGLNPVVNNGYPFLRWQGYEPYVPSNEARLGALVVKDMVGNEISLSSSFSNDITAYNVTVTNSVYSITVTPTALDSKVTITVNGQEVASGGESALIELNEGGDTTITIIVTAEDGTSEIYTLTATRKAAYTVTYDANGADAGSVPLDNSTYEQSVTVAVYGNTGNLSKMGYTFAGWNTEADGSGTNYAGEGEPTTFTMGTTDVTLYAKWTMDSSPEPGNPEEPPKVVDFTPIVEGISACGPKESEVYEIKDVFIDKEGSIYLAPKSADIRSQEDLEKLLVSNLTLKYPNPVAPFEKVTISVAELEIAGTYVFYAVDTEGLVSEPSKDAFTISHIAQLTDQQLIRSEHQLEAKTKVILHQGCTVEALESSFVIFTLMQGNTVVDLQIIPFESDKEEYSHNFPVSGSEYKVKIFVIRNFKEELAQSLSDAGNNLAEPGSAE